jgi:hypothetical protein
MVERGGNKEGAMRATFILMTVLLAGCKTAEVATTHPTTGIHVVARIEADPAFRKTEFVPFSLASLEQNKTER